MAGAPTDPLVDLLVQLCAMPCTTGEEEPIADWLADRYATRGDVVMRIANSIVAAPPEPKDSDDRPLVVLVGHTDVVPPTPEDLDPRIDGDRVIGRGTSDMKAGLAVAMDAFEDSSLREGPYRLALVGYAGEEGSHEYNELRQVLAAAPGLTEAALAIILEPTDLQVQLGCMGSVTGHVTFQGVAAHSARPWHGDNALVKAGAWLAGWADAEPDDVDVDGLVYREVTNPTQAWTDNPRNVIPGAFTVGVNYRFAPDKDLKAAEQVLRDRIGDVGEVEIVDLAPASPPSRGEAAVEAFIAAAQAEVAPKQAWTDVARFAEVGVPALNYGPGLTAQAHQAGEYVPIANLQPARDTLARFLQPVSPHPRQV